MLSYVDHELDRFIAQVIMGDPGGRPFTSSMTEAWRLWDYDPENYVELKLDMYLGVTGKWVASFYSPSRCARFEGRGPSAPCQAETNRGLKPGPQYD